MKQIKAVALSLAVCAVLSSCGSKEAVSSAGAESQAASSAVSSESVSSEQAVGESTIPDDLKFDFTYEKFLENLNVQLADAGSKPIDTKTSEQDSLQDNAFGNFLCKYYSIIDGVVFYVSYDEADNKVLEIGIVESKEVGKEAGASEFKAYINAIENEMAGSEAKTVDQKLKTSNATKTASEVTYNGETAFGYWVDSEKLTFLVRKSKSLMSDNQGETASSEAPASSKKEFSMTLDRFVQSVNSQLTKDKYSALPEPSKQESDFPGFGKANRYEYAAGDGVKLVVYADPENSNVLNILYHVDTGKVTKQSKEYYEQCAGITLAYLDREEAPGVAQKLDIDNTAKDRVATASSSKCSYSLIISGGSISLSIDPNK